MNDIDTIREMLRHAGIPWTEKLVNTNRIQTVENLAALEVLSKGHKDEEQQQHPGGYDHFVSWFVFTEAGDLHAVWAWE